MLGTPTREEIKCMNPNYTEFKFPQIKAHPWHKVNPLASMFHVFCSWCLLHDTFRFIWHILLLHTDISQAHAPRSSRSCLKTSSVLSKSEVHCCKYFPFAPPYVPMQVNNWINYQGYLFPLAVQLLCGIISLYCSFGFPCQSFLVWFLLSTRVCVCVYIFIVFSELLNYVSYS